MILRDCLVSAGFDAAEGDDLGECNVTPSGYAHMTAMLCSLAEGRVLVALEVSSINCWNESQQAESDREATILTPSPAPRRP